MEVDDLIKFVLAHPGCSQKEISSEFHVSERTVRNRVARANDLLGDVAHIDHARQRGYTIKVLDEAGFAELKMAQRGAASLIHPQTPSERVQYLLNDLLSRNDWVTLDDLSGILYASRSVLSGDLKLVEEKLAEYGLALVRRPHYGVKVEGPETNRRTCLAAVITEYGASSAAVDDVPVTAAKAFGCELGQMLDIVSRSVREASEALSFHVNSVAYQNLLIHISIALLRIAEGCYVPMEASHLDELRSRREYEVAQEIARLIKDRLGVELPDEEIAYIAIHLASKQALSEPMDPGEGLVISDEVWDVVDTALMRVWESFKFDFRSDLELRMNLARHIVPLAVRLRYHMELKNPLMGDIKTHYLLAWSMAVVAGEVIGAHYGAALSNDELGYLALAFALALERLKSEPAKKRILMVCATGVGSARLLEYRVRREFGDYIDGITTCDLLHLDTVDFSQIDYVFTTIPINHALPVPVRQVSSFFDDADATRVKELFHASGRTGLLLEKFDPELFFPHLQASSKEEVIHLLCEQAVRSHGLNPRFEKNVLVRERASVTSFGNRVAMPHPIAPVGEETFVVVGLLDTPVMWDGDDMPVQAVFLISLARGADRALGEFFDLLGDFFMDEHAITEMLDDQSWPTLARLLGACEQGVLDGS